MHNVNFKTDEALYQKFKMINTILEKKHQNVLTELIEKYVAENKKYIENPEIKAVTQATLPTFFGSTDDWKHYAMKLDMTDYVNVVMRLEFIQYLLLHHRNRKHNDTAFLTYLKDNNDFRKTNEFRYLVKLNIYQSVKRDEKLYGVHLLSIRDELSLD